MKDNKKVFEIFETQLTNFKINYNRVMRGAGFYNWDEDNFFPYKLLELNSNCAFNNSLLQTNIGLIKGFDIIIEGDTSMNKGGYGLYEFNSDFDLYDTIKQVCKDYVTFGGFAIKINIAKNGNRYLYPINFEGVRKGIDEDELERPACYYYSNDFRNRSIKPNRMKKYYSYFVEHDEAEELFWFGEGVNCVYEYPLPQYESCINEMAILTELTKMLKNKIANGFFPKNFITIDSKDMSNEQRAIIANSFKGNKSIDEAGKSFLLFDTIIDVKEVESNLSDNTINDITDHVKSAINAAWSVTSPTIAGLSGAATLGSGADEIKDALTIYFNKNVRERQNTIIKNVNRLLKEGGWNFTIKIKQLDLLEEFGNAVDSLQETSSDLMVNDAIKDLSGKQSQNLERIIRKFNNGTFKYHVAKTMLGAGFGLTEAQIETMIGLNPNKNNNIENDTVI